MSRLRAIIGYTATAIASIGVFAGFAFTGIQNQAMAGPSSYTADQFQQAPAPSSYTAAPAIKSSPRTAMPKSAVIVSGISSNSLYEVKSGDTLSAIAKAQYGKAADWTVIYYTNRALVKNPDLIYKGQTFRIPPLPRHIPAAPQPQTPAPAAVEVSGSSTSQQQTNYLTNSGGYSVTSAFQACVIRAESGGQVDIWNASGHWGLYQFSYSTWVAHGGDPSLFGKANGAYQTQIFWNTFDQDGTSDWAPYDGC